MGRYSYPMIDPYFIESPHRTWNFCITVITSLGSAKSGAHAFQQAYLVPHIRDLVAKAVPTKIVDYLLALIRNSHYV